ncbi:MAG: hypothetical protein ABEJ95_01930 [Candidatus Nanohalobium sp.]
MSLESEEGLESSEVEEVLEGGKNLREKGIPRKGLKRSDVEEDIRDLLINDGNIGYNPDEDSMDIYGDVVVTEGEDSVHIKYTVSPGTDIEGGKELFQKNANLTEAWMDEYIYADDVSVEANILEDSIAASFRFDKESYGREVEEIAETIGTYEEILELEEYCSGPAR